MAEALIIPKLGNTVEEVTLIEWQVADGATVEVGQEVLEIETDKATFAVQATASGAIHFGPFAAGDILTVLEPVAVIGAPDDSFADFQAANAPESTPESTENGAAPIPAARPVSTTSAAPDRLLISPRARKLAETKGIDLATLTATGPGGRIVERDVQAYLDQRPAASPIARKMAEHAGLNVYDLAGSGPGGRITKRDVELALATPPAAEPAAAAVSSALTPAAVPAPAPVALPDAEVLERIPLKGVRGIIAERMAASVHTTARVTLVMEADASEFVAARTRLKAQVADDWGFAPGFNDLLALIVARALRQFPFMNARLTADSIERLAHINLGMAVDTERGLLVPNIKDADAKSLRQLGATFRELADSARKGRIHSDALSGGTFTITSLGSFDVDAFTPVINLPEAAILGVGRIAAKAVVREGAIVARDMLTLSLVFDHRLVDGAPAARFLQHIKNVIEEPYLLLAA